MAPPDNPAIPPSLRSDQDDNGPLGHLPQSPMSAELQRLLASAEQRVRHAETGSSRPPTRLSPEAEIEAFLPAEVLEALDEPLDDEIDDPESDPESEPGRQPEEDSDPGWTDSEVDPERTRGAAAVAAATVGVVRESRDAQHGTAADAPAKEAAGDATPVPRKLTEAPRTSRGPEPAEPEAPEASVTGSEGPTPGPDGPQPPPSQRSDALATSPPARGLRSAEGSKPRREGSRRPSSPSRSSPTAALDPSTNPPPRVGGEVDRVTHRPGSSPPRSNRPRGPASQRPTSEPSAPRGESRPGAERATGKPTPRRPSHEPSSSPLPQSDAPRRPTPPGPARVRTGPDSSPHTSSIPPLRGDPLSLARPGGRPPLPGSAARPASGPPPSMPSNAFLTGGALEAPHLSSGPPLVQAMPIPVQELLDEPFAAPSDPRALAPRAAPSVVIPTSLQEGDAVRALAILVRTRYTGAVAFETTRGIQRAVLRDGDFVTAASGLEAESLSAFLVQRGVLSAQAAMSLARRIPGFGRHAGAALIAHGHLRQDELWPVLRTHAEWVLGRMMLVERGAASLEPEVPVRLKSEPAVFGGATGAEVLVEIARRVVPADFAVRQLGGPRTRFGDGVAPALLGECALPDHEQLHVNRARSSSLEEILASAKAPDFAAVLYALVELGVLDRRPSNAPLPIPTAPPASRPTAPTPTPPADAARPPTSTTPPAAVAPAPPAVVATVPPALPAPAPPAATSPAPRQRLPDDAARRARIVARLALVNEGDYFALLDLPHTATASDVRKVYDELRSEFDPERLLTAKTADLKDDVALILEILEEACEILGDDLRRARYLQAIEAAL